MYIHNKSPELLDTYLDLCQKFISFDKNKFKDIIKHLILEYEGRSHDTLAIEEMKQLEDQWYKSVEKNILSPDYSVYASVYYLCEAWLCWRVASRKSLLAMEKFSKTLGHSINEDMQPESCVDLGCGVGLTTIALKEYFPSAKVIGTNFENSYQYKMASHLGDLHDFSMKPEIDQKVDLVFASEYFEHIINPVSHLNDILDICDPKYMITANTFNQPAIGHFPKYLDGNTFVSGKSISRMFNDTLRQRGYIAVKADCWNNRPSYWKKYNQSPDIFSL